MGDLAGLEGYLARTILAYIKRKVRQRYTLYGEKRLREKAVVQSAAGGKKGK